MILNEMAGRRYWFQAEQPVDWAPTVDQTFGDISIVRDYTLLSTPVPGPPTTTPLFDSAVLCCLCAVQNIAMALCLKGCRKWTGTRMHIIDIAFVHTHMRMDVLPCT